MYIRPVDRQEFSTEIDIKRSRFITFIRRVASEEEARDFIADVKSDFPMHATTAARISIMSRELIL